jgi:hypothetical protein
MKRHVILGGALVCLLAVGVAGALAATGVVRLSGPVPENLLGPQMARAEVVLMINGAVHDIRVDQGRVVGIRPGALDVLERDRTRTTIPVAPDARVTVNGSRAPLSSVGRGMIVIAVRDGDSAASIVRARPGPLRG